MMNDLIYPDPQGPARLMTTFSDLFSRLDYVSSIQVFGSLSRDESDRWSDIDMIVTTQTRSQFRAAFDALRHHKTIVYHAPFTPNPYGAFVPGCVFENESIFHCLDLNFFTISEVQIEGLLDRFGPIRSVYASEKTFIPDHDDLVAEMEDPAENRISEAIHFTKKNVKKHLRGENTIANMRVWTQRLDEALQAADEKVLRPGISDLARSYLKIARTI